LEPGQELVVERGVAMPQKGNVWVRHLAGDSCFMGRRELRFEQRRWLFACVNPHVAASGQRKYAARRGYRCFN